MLRVRVRRTCLLRPLHQQRLQDAHPNQNHTISPALFAELEELSRIVDISYCVGLTGTGIQKPFKCVSRCGDFENFELVAAWNTGPLLSDSCGYIALSHAPSPKRILLAFRGTYSITNTLSDLTTIPQEYVPYPGDDDEDGGRRGAKCENCTVHMGFFSSWLNTRHSILPVLEEVRANHTDYQLTLVGHSLGGAVAALASLDFIARGWNPTVTTFGEPRIGNAALARYVDRQFNLSDDYLKDDRMLKFRRVTHTDDPVPLLPLEEWGYAMHGGEIYIFKPSIPPENSDIIHCVGPTDRRCIADGTLPDTSDAMFVDAPPALPDEKAEQVIKELRKRSGRWDVDDWIPARYRLWQLFFAHRDYFWRLGLCVPEGGWLDRPSERRR
ncbi:alpha/beta-hydrolase [Rhizodiscina lignyota]|uniref:Alpha/beta-hydrolase n=1 Tax=Rhizodiscina lignyota TaxID=1504668 RepID=A0A9P4IH87_9PEZI|nr:alpha/beta-hydrolase [Rhizodiscina lignyota]